MPNVMTTLLNMGGALCSTPQSLADAQYYSAVQYNADKTRNPLKFAGVPQTRQQISAVRRPKFTMLREHVGEGRYRRLTGFFRLSIHASAAKIQPDKFVRWCQNGGYLCPLFPASRVQHISDLHSKFALGPHHVWKYGRHPISD